MKHPLIDKLNYKQIVTDPIKVTNSITTPKGYESIYSNWSYLYLFWQNSKKFQQFLTLDKVNECTINYYDSIDYDACEELLIEIHAQKANSIDGSKPFNLNRHFINNVFFVNIIAKLRTDFINKEYQLPIKHVSNSLTFNQLDVLLSVKPSNVKKNDYITSILSDKQGAFYDPDNISISCVKSIYNNYLRGKSIAYDPKFIVENTQLELSISGNAEEMFKGYNSKYFLSCGQVGGTNEEIAQETIEYPNTFMVSLFKNDQTIVRILVLMRVAIQDGRLLRTVVESDNTEFGGTLGLFELQKLYRKFSSKQTSVEYKGIWNRYASSVETGRPDMFSLGNWYDSILKHELPDAYSKVAELQFLCFNPYGKNINYCNYLNDNINTILSNRLQDLMLTQPDILLNHFNVNKFNVYNVGETAF